MKLTIRKNLFNVLAFVGFVWLIYLISVPLSMTSWDLMKYGLEPRTLKGLTGILTMPFLHDGFEHLLGNTVPLAVLLFMLATTRTHARRVLFCLIVFGGALTWLIGLSSPVVGASGLIYALTAYLITAGLHERKPVPIATAVLIGILYGSNLLWRLLPTAGLRVAWDAHLLSAVAGAALAHLTLRQKASESPRPESQVLVSPSNGEVPVP